ncbi:hypothetical protein ACKKBF_B12340 [Auxenochlorella protothecoides x Auxenochlorella symbiontica]
MAGLERSLGLRCPAAVLHSNYSRTCSQRWFRKGPQGPPRSRFPSRLAVQSLEREQAELQGDAQPSTSQEGVDSSTSEYWQELISTPDSELFGSRARSASDAAVLRRKGHLKEQDKFINFLQEMHRTHTCLEVMQKVEQWALEHHRSPRSSRLKRMVPSLGSFFTPLRLVDAFMEYDEFFALSRRHFIPPNFAELRHILNIAQIHASATSLRLVTFDADGTLYADGAHMQHDNEMIGHVIDLMRAGVHVAIVTAAGYPNEPERFEERFDGLLAALRYQPKAVVNRFHVMGGECNYLLRVDRGRLAFVPDSEWKSEFMASWREDDIHELLETAERLLLEGAERLRLPVSVVRKERAVGVVPTAPTIYEVLEELALTVHAGLLAGPTPNLPFCAFNGGNDVFVDVGNKSIGLEALMRYVGVGPDQALHAGDRFTDSGNDVATRDCCSIIWVANPEETDFFIKILLADIEKREGRWGNGGPPASAQ